MAKKTFEILTAALAIAIIPISSSGSTLPDEQFQIPAPAEEQMRGYYINEMAESTQNTSTYVSTWVGDRVGARDNQEAPTDVVVCTSSSAPDCELRIIQQFLAILPLCDSAATFTCIEEIFAERNGKKLTIEKLGTFPTSGPTDFLRDQSINLPDGSQPLLVRIKDAPHSQGDLYIYRAELTGFRSHVNGVARKFDYRGFQAGVFAVTLRDDLTGTRRPQGGCGYVPRQLLPGESYRFDTATKVATAGCTYDEVSRFGASDTTRGCVSNSTTQCAAPYPLPLDVNFGMKIRFQLPMTGWLHGRVENPRVTYEAAPWGGSVITVLANPTKVPVFQVWKRYSELNDDLKTLLARRSVARISSWFTGPGGASNEDLATDTKKSITRHGGEVFDQTEMENFLAWLPFAKDKAAAFPTTWAVRSMSFNAQRTNACLRDTSTLNGVVSTNATLYLDGPPELNAETQTLDYKVAAPHLTPKDEVFQGTYNLVLKSSVARCLYNFTSAPISATVSIQNASGISTLEATTVTESNGWLRLSASGFTFSSPVIRVKLTQEATEGEVSKPTSEDVSTVAKQVKKKAITCAKGSKTKKIQGNKCPKGYRKV